MPLIQLTGKQTRNGILLPNGRKSTSGLPPRGGPKEELPSTATPTKFYDEDDSMNNRSSGGAPGNERKKKQFKFADLFKDEGMYHSVNDAPVLKLLRQGSNNGLMRTPL